MLYTRKGDDGTTKTIGETKRMSKSSALSEALGTLDELSAFLGLCKIEALNSNFTAVGQAKKSDINKVSVDQIVHSIQKNLFIIGAELAGSDKKITEEKVKEIEYITDTIEKELPPIKSFFISGGVELAARFDVARTIARRLERRVIALCDNGERKLSKHTRQYLNRLSSVLYALARLSNHKSGITEEAPDYK